MFYLRGVKNESFDDKFVIQKANEPHDETDFIAQPFVPTIKARQDNLHKMYYDQNVVRNKTNLDFQDKKKVIGFEGKLL